MKLPAQGPGFVTKKGSWGYPKICNDMMQKAGLTISIEKSLKSIPENVVIKDLSSAFRLPMT
jgi:hypothetical protein